ncbi:MAG: LD-carboxypeptidase, partial [Candidatus Nanopelagicales bacterium]
MRATKFGRPLPTGGTIGVFAPSGPFENRSDVLRPVEWWEARGYRVKLTDSVWAQDDYVAGTPELRVADMHSLFEDDDVDVVHCLWGGVGAIEMLPLID